MPDKKIVLMLAVLYGSAFVAAFNENIVNVALVKIMTEFSVGAETAQWLVAGYMLVTAVVVPVMAFLSRRFTLRQVFFEGCAFLGVGSVGAFFAPDFATLLIARLVQSVCTGIFIPLMMTTVLAVVPAARAGTFISLGGCAITLGPALAPAAAGVFVTLFGWRSVFLMPTAVVCALAVFGFFLIKNTGAPVKIRLDILSVALSACGLSLGVYGLSKISSETFFGVVLLAVCVAFLWAFARRQGRLKNPVLDLSPLKNPRFSVACFLSIVAMMTTFSMSVLLPLYYEAGLGESSLAAGLLLLLPIAVNAGTSVLGGRVMDRVGEWPLLPSGFFLIAAGLAATCVSGYFSTLIPVLIGSVAVYAGVGAIFSPSQAAGLRRLPREQHPHGVAILSTFIQVAACVGPALFIGVLSSVSASVRQGVHASSAQSFGFSAAVALACVFAVAGTVVAYFYAHRR